MLNMLQFTNNELHIFYNTNMSLVPTIPFNIFPKTTCLPSSHGVCFVVIKNCDPFVSLPALAMESQPAP